MKVYTSPHPRKARGFGMRRCARCRRMFRPVSASTRCCGACVARAASLAIQGFRR